MVDAQRERKIRRTWYPAIAYPCIEYNTVSLTSVLTSNLRVGCFVVGVNVNGGVRVQVIDGLKHGQREASHGGLRHTGRDVTRLVTSHGVITVSYRRRVLSLLTKLITVTVKCMMLKK